ncbi:MAG: GNAT family N-acetyltransferase [Chloroflexi bacterium]|nr:GNAT family N-acetyltransferase [Chloroflexota bacterium]
MIRDCVAADIEAIYQVINDAAQAYRGHIPTDRWKDPYMPRDELHEEISAGVTFLGYEEDGELAGVMGIQEVEDVTLIRHAYVRTAQRGRGIGGKLLARIMQEATRPALIGTWAGAVWAVSFYEGRGFQVVSTQEKERLLRKYWNVPDRQIETSVVLADQSWFASRR